MDAVDQALMDRNFLLQNITERLRRAQVRRKYVYDKGHREVSFEVGDYEWLWIQPYCQRSLAGPPHHKLSPKFFGLFAILWHVGPVAYQLKLPATAKLHDVFHVSLLKPHSGSPPTSTPFLPQVDNGDVIFKPAAVLRAWLLNDHWEILVQWMDTEPEAATWDHVDIFKQVYPILSLRTSSFYRGRQMLWTQ
ncbi:uncharacterized protein [Aristolochia californica]|uniref:uncharacterized protein n=1 Tax=Aristolochia californica TaxID=171875 RepID=UPI0035E1EA3A